MSLEGVNILVDVQKLLLSCVSTGPFGTVPSGTVSKWVRLGLAFPRDRFRLELVLALISFLQTLFI